MTLRKPHSEAIYQVERKTNGKNLIDEELVRDFTFWSVVKNRFPWDKIIEKTHDMIVLKRDVCLEDITVNELHELWFTILPWAESKYDATVLNMASMRSVNCTPHIHAIVYQAEFK